MKFLDRTEARKWKISQGLPAERGGLRNRELFPHRFHIAEDEPGKIALVERLMPRFEGKSGLMTVDDWGVWPSVNLMDDFIFVRRSLGEERHPIECNAHQFRPSDYPDLLDLVRIAVRSVWDCAIITTRGKVAVYFSHDEIGGASFRVED